LALKDDIEGVKKEMAELYYEDVFNFLTEEKMIPIKINKTAPHETGIVSKTAGVAGMLRSPPRRRF